MSTVVYHKTNIRPKTIIESYLLILGYKTSIAAVQCVYWSMCDPYVIRIHLSYAIRVSSVYVIQLSSVRHLYILSSACYPYIIRMSSVCHLYIICMTYSIRMSSVCHLYIICMTYSIRMSSVCHLYIICMTYITRKSSVCHLYIICMLSVYHPYIISMSSVGLFQQTQNMCVTLFLYNVGPTLGWRYTNVIQTSFVFDDPQMTHMHVIRMLSVCHPHFIHIASIYMIYHMCMLCMFPYVTVSHAMPSVGHPYVIRTWDVIRMFTNITHTTIVICTDDIRIHIKWM